MPGNVDESEGLTMAGDGGSGDSAAPSRIARARVGTRKTIPPERLAEIERRMLRAEAPADFVPELAKLWNRSERSVWDYTARVRKRLAARAKVIDPDTDREQIRAMLLRAYRTAEAGTERGPDAKGMVAAARTLAEVTGVSAPRKVDITTAGKPIQAMTDEELNARIAALRAKFTG